MDSRFVGHPVGVTRAVFAACLCIGLSASGQVSNQIVAVSPVSAALGVTGLTVTFTLDNDVPKPPPTGVPPTGVRIGGISGTSLAHPVSNIVTAVFSIPASEGTGAKDCVVTFSTPNGELTFSQAGGFTVTEAVPATGQPFPGYNLFTPLGSTNTYLMDNSGNIVNTWTSSYRPGLSVYLLEDGSLLRTANTGGTNFNAGGAGGRVERFDWGGSLSWAFVYTGVNHRAHHDIATLPNGNLLMIAWERKSAAEAIAAGRDPALLGDGELWPDHVIEVAPTGTFGGTIVWEWHVWDHLVQDQDAAKADFGTVAAHPERININHVLNDDADWNHINAIAYHTGFDQILLSVRQFGEIWVIDHGTTTAEAAGSTGGRRGRGGDLLYRWGNPQAYDAGTAADQQLFVQHDAQWIDEGLPGAGNILVFNNGQGRPDGDWSSVDEFVPPLASGGTYSNAVPFAPAATTWTYTSSPAIAFNASNISGAQRLPDGHTLICNGPTGTFFEVTADGETVWEYHHGSAVFRVTRYGYDYPGLAGTGLNPGEYPLLPYQIVDSGQTQCYNNTVAIPAPSPGDPFAGQDSQYAGTPMRYSTGADGKTVADNSTGLTWSRTPDLDNDGTIDVADKLYYADAVAYAATLNAAGFGGFRDWRLPSIKELYSLMDFRGTDISGLDIPDPVPFIDTNYFAFGYGDTNAAERVIDAQFASTTLSLDTVMSGQQGMFGLNLADGRIKGYPIASKTFYVYYVRGNTNYGVNAFVDVGNGVVSDHATGLMWQQSDSGAGLTWESALAYAEGLSLAGYRDWRLPNAKELQSIVDYTRAPGATASAALDPVFQCTVITNEAGALDYPWYWASTTHANTSASPGREGIYVCFGRALGYFNGSWLDVHGAGCQRSDPKGGSLGDWTYTPYGYYSSQAPQGDAVRIYNRVRCVRGGATPPVDDSDDDGLTDWFEYRHATNTTAMAAGADDDGDGADNAAEQAAGTSPTEQGSVFTMGEAQAVADGVVLSWSSEPGRTYRIERTATLGGNAGWSPVASGVAATAPVNTYTDPEVPEGLLFYRVLVE